jgi:DNA-binding transcriptional LysR family regulator
MAQVTPLDLAAYPILRSRPFELEDDEANLILHLPHKRPALTVEDYEVLMRITYATDAIWTTSSLAASEWIASGALVPIPMNWLAEKPNAYMTAYHLKGRTMTPAATKVMERITKLGLALCNAP